MKIRSKAKTLKYLEEHVKCSRILPLLIFQADEDIESMAKEISANFISKVIIRSSAEDEDTAKYSNAGHYESVLNVDPSSLNELVKALKTVVLSFNSEFLDKEEILVQPMLQDVVASGVAFSCDIDTLSSYYIINYDLSGKTDSVTDGKGENLITYIEYKNSKIDRNNAFLDSLILAIDELEKILENSFLDIEFGYDGKDIYIFQARPIVETNKNNLSDINLEKALFKLFKKIKKLNIPHPNLLGGYTMFGVMPDWNPAEIIGKKPKPLSLSLYKELITDSIWAYQRDNYGYRNLRSHPLLVSFLGVAYIDIRVSFNSFIPKKLDNEIADKLVNYYLDTLRASPDKHDKVEFDIILSCIDFSTRNKLDAFPREVFTSQEIDQIQDSLLDVTNNIFTLYKKDLKKIDILKYKYESIINSNLSTIDKIYWLSEDCKRYGTLPFAGLARAAFIGISFLKSFEANKIISKDESNQFLNSLNSVSKKLNMDFARLNKENFLKVYGHLRPGTYEITSKRYDENFDKYFSYANMDVKENIFNFTENQLSQIDTHLRENNINISSNELIKFISESIEAREYSKFVFTKSLSKILTLIEEIGDKNSISKDDLAYLDYQSVLSLYSSLDYEDVKDSFEKNIEENKLSHRITYGVKLPDLLMNENEIYGFFNLQSSANFITLSAIEEQIVKESEIYEKNLTNKIVCIKSADPGYDFLFTKNIGALLTCYGGVNSHMAIRCAELNIPAVIGVGVSEYLDICNYNVISIDCKIERIKKIR